MSHLRRQEDPSARNALLVLGDGVKIQLPTFDYVDELWPGYKGPLLIGGFECGPPCSEEL